MKKGLFFIGFTFYFFATIASFLPALLPSTSIMILPKPMIAVHLISMIVLTLFFVVVTLKVEKIDFKRDLNEFQSLLFGVFLAGIAFGAGEVCYYRFFV